MDEDVEYSDFDSDDPMISNTMLANQHYRHSKFSQQMISFN